MFKDIGMKGHAVLEEHTKFQKLLSDVCYGQKRASDEMLLGKSALVMGALLHVKKF